MSEIVVVITGATGPSGTATGVVASDVTFTPTGTIAATNAQTAIAEVATDAAAALAAHEADGTAAHAASAISFSAVGTIAGTDVQTAVAEVAADAASALASHEADTTNVHGIADTSALVTTARTISTTTPLSGGGALSGNLTLSVGAASDTASGVVELATTAETTTGTDTARAVTPAGLLNATTASNINARVAVKKAGSLQGTRRGINFIEGSGVTITTADDSGNEEVDVTIAASGGSSLGFVGSTAGFAYVTPGLLRQTFVEPIITFTSGVTCYFGPYINPATLGVDGIQFKIQAITGTANVRVAFIAMNTSTWQPSSLTYAVAELTYTTTGEKTPTFASQSFPSGPYLVGVRTDNSTLALSGMRMQSTIGWRGGEEGFVNFSHFTVSEAYAAFASTPTAWTAVVTQSTSSASGVAIPVSWRVG